MSHVSHDPDLSSYDTIYLTFFSNRNLVKIITENACLDIFFDRLILTKDECHMMPVMYFGVIWRTIIIKTPPEPWCVIISLSYAFYGYLPPCDYYWLNVGDCRTISCWDTTTPESVRENWVTLGCPSSSTELRWVKTRHKFVQSSIQWSISCLQVIGIFAGFAILLLVASPLLLVAAPCLICCKCR